MAKIPTIEDWVHQIEMALMEAGLARPTGGVLAELQNDHVLAIVNDLLEDYNYLRTQPKETRGFRKHMVAIYLLEACEFWLKKGRSAIQDDPLNPVGGKQFVQFQPEVIRSSVEYLRDTVSSKVRKFYRMLDTDELDEIRQKLLTVQIGTRNHEADADARKKRRFWMETDAARAEYKLRFRGGSAHRKLADATIGLFTTRPEETERGDGYMHFAMDRRGRIYCGFNRRAGRSDNFVHSSFFAGADVMAAGMMKIKGGAVVGINNDSGHYRPEGRHMAMVLQRLRLYGAPLGNVSVGQINPNNGTIVATHKAQTVLNWNGFPPPGR